MRRTEYSIVGKYDPAALCPKCGHDDVGSYYDLGCRASGCRDHPERIDRHCRRCHYEWSESPVAAVRTTDDG